MGSDLPKPPRGRLRRLDPFCDSRKTIAPHLLWCLRSMRAVTATATNSPGTRRAR